MVTSIENSSVHALSTVVQYQLLVLLGLYTIGGLDWWTGLVDWTTGLTDFHFKHTFGGSIIRLKGAGVEI